MVYASLQSQNSPPLVERLWIGLRWADQGPIKEQNDYPQTTGSSTSAKKANQASFAVAEIVAKQMKPHTIAESLILPACVTIAKIFFGDAAAEEIKNIPLSDNTIGRRITNMSVDIEKGVMLKLKAADFFAIQVDESTDLSGKSQLLAFIRFIENDGIVEDFLCCRELPETTKGQDIYDALTSYLNHWDLTWEKCVGICTDGCPSMIASVKGFVTLVKQSQPNIFITHCFLHREALVAKAIGPELKEVLDMVVKMVNYLKSRPVKCRQFTKLCESMDAEHVTLLFHTEVRWLSRGRVLSRFYELREELMIFFTSNNIEYVKFLSDERLDKYFPSISLEEYDWIRNPFVESLNVDFSLTDEEELAGISNDRTLRMKHTELDLDSFWILTAKEYPSISNKALRILLQFSTSYLCEIGFSTMTNIKRDPQEKNELLGGSAPAKRLKSTALGTIIIHRYKPTLRYMQFGSRGFLLRCIYMDNWSDQSTTSIQVIYSVLATSKQ
ncbi:zinc finger BED domain-containing protein 5-like [Tachypleus tridentatus]|uniref:zinc finger BED domain-containing protein 5-like n=1 Tax=Tachypleus tridentatus TaxID=6853 RepID=UPI003FD36741